MPNGGLVHVEGGSIGNHVEPFRWTGMVSSLRLFPGAPRPCQGNDGSHPGIIFQLFATFFPASELVEITSIEKPPRLPHFR